MFLPCRVVNCLLESRCSPRTPASGHSTFLLISFPGLKLLTIGLIHQPHLCGFHPGEHICPFLTERNRSSSWEPMYSFLSMSLWSASPVPPSPHHSGSSGWVFMSCPLDPCAVMFFIHAFTHESGLSMVAALRLLCCHFQDPQYALHFYPSASAASAGATILVRVLPDLLWPNPPAKGLLFPRSMQFQCYCLHCDCDLAQTLRSTACWPGLNLLLLASTLLIMLSYALDLIGFMSTRPLNPLKALTPVSHTPDYSIFYFNKLGLSVLHRVANTYSWMGSAHGQPALLCHPSWTFWCLVSTSLSRSVRAS